MATNPLDALLGKPATDDQPPVPIDSSAASPASPPAPPSLGVRYVRPPMESTNPLFQIIGKMMGGKTPYQKGPAIAAIDSDPTADASKAMGLAPLSPVYTTGDGKPMYDYEGVQKRGGQIATLKMLSQRMGNAHPPVSPEMANAIATGDQAQVNTIWQKHLTDVGLDPNTPLPQQFVTMANAAKGTNIKGTMADAAGTRSNAFMMSQLYKLGGGDALAKAASQANMNVLAAKKAQGIIDQISAGDGTPESKGRANVRQRSELGAAVAQLAGSGSGVLTDQKMNEFIPQSLRGKVAGWQEWWTNDNAAMDFTGFLPQLQDMVNRETTINQGVSNDAAEFGKSIANSRVPGAAKTIDRARAGNPIFNPPGAATNPPPAKKVDMTGMVKMTDPKGGVHAVPAGKIIKYRASPYNWTPQ